MKIKNKTFEIEILKDVIWKEENCRTGYKKCGLVNSNDSLCLKLDENEDCPINKIIIDNNETYGNYKSFKLGDKYIHFSNEEINNRFFKNFYITEEEIETTLDQDSLTNLKKYNPNIWGYRSGIAYLNAEYYYLPKKEKFEQLIEDYKKITEMYNPGVIKDMNEKIVNKTIMALGIIIFVLTTFIWIDIGFYFLLKNQKDDGDCLKNADFSAGSSQNPLGAICGILCAICFIAIFWCFFRYSCELCLGKQLNQKKLSIALFLIFFPELILAILSMVYAFIKKNKIDDYLSMEYINIFQNKSVKSVQDNLDRVIILIIVNIAIFVLYPILVLIANKIKDDDDYDTVKNNIENSLSEYKKY